MEESERLGKITNRILDSIGHNNKTLGDVDTISKSFISGDKAKSVEEILNAFSEKVEDDYGKVDYKRAAKAWELLIQLQKINQDYDSLELEDRIAAIKLEVYSVELREKELRLSLYTYNELFKDLYNNANNINNLPEEPLPSSVSQKSFALQYLKKIEKIYNLGSNILDIIKLLCKEIKNEEFATSEEFGFLREMTTKLEKYRQ